MKKTVLLIVFLTVSAIAIFEVFSDQLAFEKETVTQTCINRAHASSSIKRQTHKTNSEVLKAIDDGDLPALESSFSKLSDERLRFKALSHAVSSQNIDIISYLIENCAALDREHSFTAERETPLVNSVRVMNREIFELLIRNGALVDAKRPAAHIFAFVPSGYANPIKMYDVPEVEVYRRRLKVLDIVSAIIAAGATIDGRIDPRSPVGFNGNTGTFLNAAASQGFPELVNLLIDSGANVNYVLQDCDKRYPSHRLGFLQKPLPRGDNFLIDNLVTSNASLKQANACGTPLWNAVSFDNLENVEILIRNGADLDKTTRLVHQITPLMIAALRGNEKLVKLLLKNGADPTLKTTRFSRPTGFFEDRKVEHLNMAADFAKAYGHPSIEKLINHAIQTWEVGEVR